MLARARAHAQAHAQAHGRATAAGIQLLRAAALYYTAPLNLALPALPSASTSRSFVTSTTQYDRASRATRRKLRIKARKESAQEEGRSGSGTASSPSPAKSSNSASHSKQRQHGGFQRNAQDDHASFSSQSKSKDSSHAKDKGVSSRESSSSQSKYFEMIKKSRSEALRLAKAREDELAKHGIGVGKQDSPGPSSSSKDTDHAKPAKQHEEAVPGWGPDTLQPPPPPPSASTAALADRQQLPHMRPRQKFGPEEGWTTFQTAAESRRTRLVQPGSYVSDAEWYAKTSEERAARKRALSRGGHLVPDSVPFGAVEGLRDMNVPKLAHGLDRVLFNPGVHRLRDPRSGIYNYDPYLRRIPDVDFFDYQALTPYTTSSKDNELITVAQRERARFCGSTSSLTAIFSQVYFLISRWRAPSNKLFSPELRNKKPGFSFAARLPASVNLTPQAPKGQGSDPDAPLLYAIDSDKSSSGESENSNYVLANLGKSMEKLLTATPEEYATYMRVNRTLESQQDEAEKESYHYAKAGNSFVMRSQLDCSDDRLPRKTFDLKTRAVVSVRHDRANWSEASGYQIKNLLGLWESFERERFDMARSAWLKYYFQAKIGCMDGIFVAYHNAAQMFGFEYIPLEDMSKHMFGSVEMGDQAFKLTIGLSERVLERAAELYPGRKLRLMFETPDEYMTHASTKGGASMDTMRVWIQPRTEDGELVQGETTQLDVTVDRYIFDRRVVGPVDFEEYSRFEKSTMDETDKWAEKVLGEGGEIPDEQSRPIEWSLDYIIRPRTDLDQKTIEEVQGAAVERQRNMAALILPNIDAVNEREYKLEEELSRNPAALQKYKEDKRSGVASGMPAAPGQVDLFSMLNNGESVAAAAPSATEDDVEGEEDREGSPDAEEDARDVRFDEDPATMQDEMARWRQADLTVQALRTRAVQGAREAREIEENDPLEEFESVDGGSPAASSRSRD